MITFLRTWVNQIIVAVIIATILEMLLPKGNNKKYIKMIIGLYVLFAILQPVFVKFTGNSIKLEDFSYQKYFKNSILETSSQNFEDTNSKLIEQTYINSIQKDMELKLEKKGYLIINCHLQMDSTKGESYGTIQNLNLKIKKIEEKEKKENTIKIEGVNVQIDNKIEERKETNQTITEKEKIKLIEYLSEEYIIDKKNIQVN